MARLNVKRPPEQWPVWRNCLHSPRQCTWQLQFRAQWHNCVTAGKWGHRNEQ